MSFSVGLLLLYVISLEIYPKFMVHEGEKLNSFIDEACSRYDNKELLSDILKKLMMQDVQKRGTIEDVSEWIEHVE